MKIAELSVKNYRFTVVVFIMLVVLGFNSLNTIPKQEDPTFPIPRYGIVVVYPGASPKDMEELIVDKIESSMNELDDVKRLISNIDDGVCFVRLEFDDDADPDKKYDEVLRQIQTVRGNLPQDILRLEVIQFNSALVNIVQFALVSDNAGYAQLEDQAKELKKRLERIKTLSKVETWAYPKQEVRIAVDLEKTAQLRLPLNQVIGALQANNTNIPGGGVDVGPRKFNIKTSGNYQSVDEVRNTVVGTNAGQLVYVKDIAEVQMRDEEQVHIGRYNGKRAVFLTANLKERKDIFNTRKEIDAEVAGFTKQLPAGISLENGFDQSANVGHRLGGFVRDFGIAIVLVLLTLLPLGLRASLIVMISIPLSLSMGLAYMNIAGFTINQLSIVGFVIALGLLVDDSIVVIENIARFLRMGYKPVEAAIEATQQIGMAVIGCTAALIFAFLPLLFLPGASGQFILSLPVAVISTIVASLIVSLTIIPFLSSTLLKEEKDEHGNFFMRGLHWLVEGTYRRVLHRAIARPYTTLIVSTALFVGSLLLVKVIGFSLFPKANIRQFLVNIEAPEGSALTETDRATRFVESKLAEYDNVEWYMSNVGRGNPRVYYNTPEKSEQTNIAQVFVQLKQFEGNTTPAELDRLRTNLAQYPNARIEVYEFEQGPPLDAPIAIRIIGEDLDTLKHLAAQVEAIVRNTPGTQYVNNPIKTVKTDLRVAFDRDKGGMLGVPAVEVNKTVRMAVAGLPVGKFRDSEGEEYALNVTLEKGRRQTVDALDRVYVASMAGQLVPLRQVADVRFETSPTKINHYNRERAANVTAYVQTGYNTNKLTQQILAELAKIKTPEGYSFKAAGEVEQSQESFGGLGGAIIVAVFGIFAILILEFGTFKSTFIVLSVIPLGVIGGMTALYIAGYTLSFTSVIGFIALIGIEIKNTILLVDFTNQLRARGVGLDEAIEQAGETRFIPIILTTLTALGGLIPLAIERSPLYSPLAVVIIGGLISSTILTRVVTPVMYKLLPPKVQLEQ
jgi:multidrug efflux pump subunit AcrB